MNDTFFDNIDTQEKAYWLGFLYADGYHTKPYRVGVKLAVKDKSHIEKLCDAVQVSYDRIKFRPPSEKFCMGRIIRSSGSSELNINNKHLSISAKACGLVPNKSLILTFPSENILPLKFVRHFIRGYFDGDGCLTVGITNHISRYRMIILSSKDFCEGLCEQIQRSLNIRVKIWDKKQTNIYKICISGNRQVKQFMDWLYNDSTIHLDRKHILYEQMCDVISAIDNRAVKSYSKYNNITFDKSRNKWIAMARINKKTVHVGRFDLERDAITAQADFMMNACQ